jgi:hypothetical protein
LKVFKENSEGNWAEIFKHFPDKQEEEVIFNFLKLPYTHFLNLTGVVEESHPQKIKYGEFGISETAANISNGVNGKVQKANGNVEKAPGGPHGTQENILKSHLEIFKGILSKRKK